MRNSMKRLTVLSIAGAAMVLAGCAGTTRPSAAGRPEVASALIIERLSQRLDSLTLQVDSLRSSAARLQDTLRDRDEQLRITRLELQRLKEIDLKPIRRPPV